MSVQPTPRMTVDAFLAWADGRPGRYELVDGTAIAMSPQTVGHARTKYRVHTAIARALETSGLSCEMIPDGVTVRIDAHTAFEPDALVQCDGRLPDATMEAASPILVVEVLSPSTKRIDTGKKLEGYFRLPSIVHYLIVDPERPMVIHHRRGEAGVIETRIVSSGSLHLSPPGFALDVADLFARPDP